jgi:hypothetical protein
LTDKLCEDQSSAEFIFSINHMAEVRASTISIGSQAANILKRYRSGRVLAVFERSFYVQFADDVLCVGLASIGRGPLHVLLAFDNDVLPSHVINDVLIGIAPGCCDSFDTTDRAFYTGLVARTPVVPGSIEYARQALSQLIPPTGQGYAWITANTDWQYRQYIHATQNLASASASEIATETPTTSVFVNAAYSLDTSNIHDSFLKRTRPALYYLYCWLKISLKESKCNFTEVPWQIGELLGAGPGLTPSGDDLLAGVLLSLHRLQRVNVAHMLWQVIDPQLTQRTNVISAAHLRMAAHGQCAEPINSLLAYVFAEANGEMCFENRQPDHTFERCTAEQGYHPEPENIQQIATAIQSQANRIGASSGWDTLAGISVVLHAL